MNAVVVVVIGCPRLKSAGETATGVQCESAVIVQKPTDWLPVVASTQQSGAVHRAQICVWLGRPRLASIPVHSGPRLGSCAKLLISHRDNSCAALETGLGHVNFSAGSEGGGGPSSKRHLPFLGAPMQYCQPSSVRAQQQPRDSVQTTYFGDASQLRCVPDRDLAWCAGLSGCEHAAI